MFFLRSRREQLAALQNEVHLSLRIVNQIAAHYELDGGRHSIATMLQESRDGLVDSPVPDKRDIIKLLVERIVVDCRGEFDIQTRVPLYTSHPGQARSCPSPMLPVTIVVCLMGSPQTRSSGGFKALPNSSASEFLHALHCPPSLRSSIDRNVLVSNSVGGSCRGTIPCGKSDRRGILNFRRTQELFISMKGS